MRSCIFYNRWVANTFYRWDLKWCRKDKGGDDMILRDMINRIDTNTIDVGVYDSEGQFIGYADQDVDEKFNEREVIFPINGINGDNGTELAIWIEV